MSAQSARDAIAAGLGVALVILTATQWRRWPWLRRWWNRMNRERALRSPYKG